jgi:hypothetical protein
MMPIARPTAFRVGRAALYNEMRPSRGANRAGGFSQEGDSMRTGLLKSLGTSFVIGCLAASLSAEDADEPEDAQGEGYDDELFGSDDKRPTDDDQAPADIDAPDEAVDEPTDEPEPREDATHDPTLSDDEALVAISGKMRQVEERFEDSRSDQATQRLGKEVVDDLDRLIRELEKKARRSPVSRREGSRSGTPQPQSSEADNTGASDSSQRAGETDAADPETSRESLVKDVWGQLPDRIRQRMQQSPLEEFLPEFELMIEDYFKALAE